LDLKIENGIQLLKKDSGYIAPAELLEEKKGEEKFCIPITFTRIDKHNKKVEEIVGLKNVKESLNKFAMKKLQKGQNTENSTLLYGVFLYFSIL